MKKYLLILVLGLGIFLMPHLSLAATWTYSYMGTGGGYTNGVWSTDPVMSGIVYLQTSATCSSLAKIYDDFLTGDTYSVTSLGSNIYSFDATGGIYTQFQTENSSASYITDCGSTIILSDTPLTSPAATITFAFPTEGTSTNMFDNFALIGANLTSTDEYALQVQWYLPYNQTMYPGSQKTVTGADLVNGVLMPFVGFPSIPNSTIVSLPVTAYATLTDVTSYTGTSTAQTQVAFNVNANNNATSTGWSYVTVSSGTVSVAVSSTSLNPFYTNGTNIVCPAPTGTIWNDMQGTMDWIGCNLVTIFVYPHQATENMAQNSFGLLQSDVPFSFVYSAVNGFESSSIGLESASSSDLSFSFLSSAGKSGIIPTSSISVISQTAYAALTATAGGTSISDVFTVEDYIFYFLLLCLIVGLTIKLL